MATHNYKIRIKHSGFLTEGLMTLMLASGFSMANDTAAPSKKYGDEILPIFENYCHDCHADGLSKGGLDLDDYTSITEMIADRDQWQKIRDHLDFRLMPPPDEFAPNDEERAKLVKWIDDTVFPVDPDNPDPGELPLRRLNRTEYQNTIRDLLDVEINTGEILPPDDSGHGFDNIGEALTISPVHLERYLEAAQLALSKALDFSPPRHPEYLVNGERFSGDASVKDDGLFLTITGENRAVIKVREAGTYRIKMMAGSMLCGDEFPKLEVMIDGASLEILDIPNPMDSLVEYVVETKIERQGEYELILAFINNFKDANAPNGFRDRNILLDTIVLQGPLEAPPFTNSDVHLAIAPKRLHGEKDEVYFDRVMEGFLPRAFRRPVADDELKHYRHFLKLANEQEESVESAIQQALAASLISPSFLFREEPPIDEENGEGKALINQHALASRLSYFLWSSMPDKRLMDLANSGHLRQNLQIEIKRMLASPKSDSLIDNFVGQWLQMRDLGRVRPNGRNYNGIDQRLPGDMRIETEMLVKHIMRENLPIHTLLDADYTFLNERLARHYGIEGVTGEEFRKVSIAHTKRRGLLGHASFLTLTSHQTKTSPVLRGKYVLENILNTPPPPAPPNIPSLEDARDHGESQTMRQELERHRDDPACSSCHALMDPIGFGLENYDIVGRWRDTDEGESIDPADTLATRQKFASAVEMRDIFINDFRDEFHRAFSAKLLTYALGRGLGYYDRPAINEIVMKGETEDGRFLSWVIAVAESVPFQYRRH